MLVGDDRLEHALELAYRHLNQRDRTAAEVRRHLERRGLARAVVDEAITALGEQGYLDDARFVRLYVEDKRELEQWGSERITRTLIARGIDRDLIEEALSDHALPCGELDRALALLKRRFALPPVDGRGRERALGVLLRKGYESELALDAVTIYAREGPSPALD